jgi:hypothetical protein
MQIVKLDLCSRGLGTRDKLHGKIFDTIFLKRKKVEQRKTQDIESKRKREWRKK